MKIEPSTFQRISLVVALVFFGMAILGIVGEVLGWWNEVGEVLTIVGTIGGLLVGWTALANGSSEEQVGRVHRAVVANGGKLDKLDTIDGKLDKLEKLDDLDAIQLELDRQTGVLDEQLSVLTQVRDRL